MKLCIDCKYCTPDRDMPDYSNYSRCAHPSELSLVDGKPTEYCSSTRVRVCGPEAKLFEPKAPPVSEATP